MGRKNKMQMLAAGATADQIDTGEASGEESKPKRKTYAPRAKPTAEEMLLAGQAAARELAEEREKLIERIARINDLIGPRSNAKVLLDSRDIDSEMGLNAGPALEDRDIFVDNMTVRDEQDMLELHS